MGNDWLDRFRVGRIARQVADGIEREVPSFGVAERADFADGAWSLRVSLPTGLDAVRFAAAMTAENLPCAAGNQDGTVRLPLGPAYSGEDVEHLVLAVAKVAHYLVQDVTEGPATDVSS